MTKAECTAAHDWCKIGLSADEMRGGEERRGDAPSMAGNASWLEFAGETLPIAVDMLERAMECLRLEACDTTHEYTSGREKGNGLLREWDGI